MRIVPGTASVEERHDGAARLVLKSPLGEEIGMEISRDERARIAKALADMPAPAPLPVQEHAPHAEASKKPAPHHMRSAREKE